MLGRPKEPPERGTALTYLCRKYGIFIQKGAQRQVVSVALEPNSVGGVLVSEQSKVRLTAWICFMYLHRYILIWLSTTVRFLSFFFFFSLIYLSRNFCYKENISSRPLSYQVEDTFLGNCLFP